MSKPREKFWFQTEYMQVFLRSVINSVAEIKPDTDYTNGDSKNFKI